MFYTRLMIKGKKKIRILSIGRLKSGPEADLAEYYRSRAAWPISIEEYEDRKEGPGQKEREGKLLLDAMKNSKNLATFIILDERGKEYKSREFAGALEKWLEKGDLMFLLGGADGLSEEVKDRADISLSLGRMTWPHKLARIMLLEQLYRAGQIQAGHPYHRD